MAVTMNEMLRKEFSNGSSFVHVIVGKDLYLNIEHVLDSVEKLTRHGIKLFTEDEVSKRYLMDKRAYRYTYLEHLTSLKIHMTVDFHKIFESGNFTYDDVLIVVRSKRDEHEKDTLETIDEMFHSMCSASLIAPLKAFILTDKAPSTCSCRYAWSDEYDDFILSVLSDDDIDYLMESIMKEMEELKELVDSLQKNDLVDENRDKCDGCTDVFECGTDDSFKCTRPGA